MQAFSSTKTIEKKAQQDLEEYARIVNKDRRQRYPWIRKKLSIMYYKERQCDELKDLIEISKKRQRQCEELKKQMEIKCDELKKQIKKSKRRQQQLIAKLDQYKEQKVNKPNYDFEETLSDKHNITREYKKKPSQHSKYQNQKAKICQKQLQLMNIYQENRDKQNKNLKDLITTRTAMDYLHQFFLQRYIQIQIGYHKSENKALYLEELDIPFDCMGWNNMRYSYKNFFSKYFNSKQKTMTNFQNENSPLINDQYFDFAELSQEQNNNCIIIKKQGQRIQQLEQRIRKLEQHISTLKASLKNKQNRKIKQQEQQRYMMGLIKPVSRKKRGEEKVQELSRRQKKFKSTKEEQQLEEKFEQK